MLFVYRRYKHHARGRERAARRIRVNIPWMLVIVLSLIGCFVPPTAVAVYEKSDGDYPWKLPYYGRHDQPIMDKLGGGFFMNVGPTGLRARITHENPCYFTIKFVFDNSPAAGKIQPGDIVVGANGHIMNVPHEFGRRTVTGMVGPMTEMAKLIEDSQGKDGKLDMIVWPGGDQHKQKVVALQIEPLGRFAPTFPFNCERTDRTITRLCDFLVGEYEYDKGFKGRVHTSSACVLALMASGDKKYEPLIKQIMAGYRDNRYDPNNGGGFPTWGWGYDGIVMGEYYLLSHDQSLVPAMASLAKAFEDGQDWQNGGYSHKPYPAIAVRIAAGGPKGYGAMSQPGGLSMVAQSLFKEAGLDYSKQCYERLHQSYLDSVGKNGYVDYGFPVWDHALIELETPEKSPAKAAHGVGYPCPTGMKNIGRFKVLWPTAEETRSGVNHDLTWMVKEADGCRVYEFGGAKRLVIRSMYRPEPTGPLPMNDQPISHYGRAGQGALAHLIGNTSNQSWRWLGQYYAVACANSPNALLEGHASTLMGTLWGSLGAARADEKRFQQYMQGIKWWFIMAETYDGGFVVMPGRDYASTDNVYGGRALPTATAALILSVSRRQLRITGADSSHTGAVPSTPSTPRHATPVARPSTPAATAAPVVRRPAPTNSGPSAEARKMIVKRIIDAKRNLADVKKEILDQCDDPAYGRAKSVYEGLRQNASKPTAGDLERQAVLDAGAKLNRIAEQILDDDPRVAAAQAELIEAMNALSKPPG
ncbi:MAG: hypothetical protein GC159_07450 [Phycisphaera sp.]|nr:hypothetical protein [Phycisphaera sp.]